MPRGIELYIPFPSRISPEVEAADARHLTWPCSFGLLETEAARRRHARAMYADLGARFQPAALGEYLDLSVDQMSWYFILDDVLDHPREPRSPVRELMAAHLAALGHAPLSDADPIARAFADLWRRSRQGMSPTWCARAADHWRHYFTACRYEAENRQAARPLDLPDHLRMRLGTVGAQPILDLAERIDRFEVPARAFASPHLVAMRRAVIEITIIQNELCSVEKEEAVGDPNNVVLVLEREQGCSRASAVELAVDMIRRRSSSYLELERDLPALQVDLNLDDGERAAVDRYAEAMRALARGAYDWSERSGRYAERDW